MKLLKRCVVSREMLHVWFIVVTNDLLPDISHPRNLAIRFILTYVCKCSALSSQIITEFATIQWTNNLFAIAAIMRTHTKCGTSWVPSEALIMDTFYCSFTGKTRYRCDNFSVYLFIYTCSRWRNFHSKYNYESVF